MTPSLLLSPTSLPLPTSSDAPDCSAKLNISIFSSSTPFGSAGMATMHVVSESATCPRAYRQWTGLPTRAIIPLPARCQKMSSNGAHHSQDATDAIHPRRVDSDASRVRPAVGSACATPLGPVRDNADAGANTDMDTDVDADVDSEAERDVDDEDEDEDADKNEEDVGYAGNGDDAMWHRSYESITAAYGLAAWSFEELRAECYAQSLIARGTKPLPVVQPFLAIPPAFVPRIVPRNKVERSPKE